VSSARGGSEESFISRGWPVAPSRLLVVQRPSPTHPYSYPIPILSLTHSHAVPQLKRRVQQPYASNIRDTTASVFESSQHSNRPPVAARAMRSNYIASNLHSTDQARKGQGCMSRHSSTYNNTPEGCCLPPSAALSTLSQMCQPSSCTNRGAQLRARFAQAYGIKIRDMHDSDKPVAQTAESIVRANAL